MSGRIFGLVVMAAVMVGMATPASAFQDATPPVTIPVLNDQARPHDVPIVIDPTHNAPPHSVGSRVTVSGDRTALFGTLAIYSIMIASASLFGGWLPGHIKISHTRFQLLISLVGGLLLGIGVFHLLPHSLREMGGSHVDTAAMWLMWGILLMFFLLRAFHVHHHEPAEDTVSDLSTTSLPVLHDLSHQVAEVHDHHAGCQHGHHHAHVIPHNRMGWIGLFFGLGVHTLLDGLALGAAMQADAEHGIRWMAAIGVMLGITLHKPLDSLSITTLMMHTGQTPTARWTANLIYACLCPIATLAFLLGVPTGGESSHLIIGSCLAFSAGAFICLSLADLLPEMEFHSHDRVRLSTALAIGIVLAWGIRFLEPTHLHH